MSAIAFAHLGVVERVVSKRRRRLFVVSDFVRVLIEDRTKIIRIIWLHKSERIGIAISGLVCFISARITVVEGTGRRDGNFTSGLNVCLSANGFYPSIDREYIGIMIRSSSWRVVIERLARRKFGEWEIRKYVIAPGV